MPYQGAVSKKRTPCSQASRTVARATSSGTAGPPIGAAPKPSGVTLRSLSPTRRGVVTSMGAPPGVRVECSGGSSEGGLERIAGDAGCGPVPWSRSAPHRLKGNTMVWQPEVDELKRRHAMAEAMGGPEGVARQRTRGKLMVRERLDMLVDPGSFQQMGKLAGHAEYDADGNLTAFTPGSRLRGVAKVNGRRVWLQATDFSIRGASGNDDDGGVDIGHGHPDALELRLPAVFLIDTAGGSVNEYNELGRTYIPDGPEYSESVSNQLSLAPVVSVVLGPAAGGAAPLPPLAHFSVMAKGTGQVFPGGPPVVKAALGIEIDKEDLGGWRIHTRGSGVVDNAAESEADAIDQAKRFLSYLPDNVWEMPPRGDTSDDPNRRDERLLSLVPRDIRKVYDPYVMIEGVFDKGSFFEIAPAYGRSRVIGLARTHGYPIGVITSNPKYKGGSMDTAAGGEVDPPWSSSATRSTSPW